jgi:hypothetical protein
MAEKKEKKNPKKVDHAVKRCPFCGAYLKPDANRCDGCRRKVGPPDRHGTAKKPVDWRAYLSALVTVGAFCYFLYYIMNN